MNTITITVSEERLLKLQEVATRINVSLEELVLMGIDELIQRQNAAVESEIADKFYTLASQWESEVEGMSSSSMFQHPAYQEIVSMGNKVIPLLLSELKQNPLYWLSALNVITGVNPIQPSQRGKVKQMAQAWLEWGRNQGYMV